MFLVGIFERVSVYDAHVHVQFKTVNLMTGIDDFDVSFLYDGPFFMMDIAIYFFIHKMQLHTVEITFALKRLNEVVNL